LRRPLPQYALSVPRSALPSMAAAVAAAAAADAKGPVQLPARLGPEPTLISRKEVEALYDTLEAVKTALSTLGVEYIVTGGSLLGAVRQHSILFCDDDIDVTIIDRDGTAYPRVQEGLAAALGKAFRFYVRPWEGGDKVRKVAVASVFVDIFVLTRYPSLEDLTRVIGVKKNGQPQSAEYVAGIVQKIRAAAVSQGEAAPLFPCWHFATRKAIEMWPKEVYRDRELLPLARNLHLGPVVNVSGPQTPVLLLKRAFGADCFDVYYQSGSHKKATKHAVVTPSDDAADVTLPPLVAGGGAWEHAPKVTLDEAHYIPMQPEPKAKRRPTAHCRAALEAYLLEQVAREADWLRAPAATVPPPRRTVYMDGVFDLFHVGHLRAIQQCTALGDRVIVGVTGDADAAHYKRSPVIAEADRVAVVEAIRGVNKVVCPCPLVVTEQFMEEHDIDLVVHGFVDPADEEKQAHFFAAPRAAGKFQTIEYYRRLSTTDIIAKVQALTLT